MTGNRTQLIQALAELAYSVAKADGSIHHSEKRLFKNIMREKFQDEAWIAESRFDILDSAIAPDVNSAYDNALVVIKNNIKLFDDKMSRIFIDVIETVADAFQGTEDAEIDLIDRMKKDFRELTEAGSDGIISNI